ncbi:hypothetical protein KKA14_08135 [bacterium]|nr:hypothetical protein [bacterium]
MEKEISDFDGWWESVHLKAKELDLTETLDTISQQFKNKLGLNIWFAIVMGRRWSYLTGVMCETPLGANFRRVRLVDDIGLISNNLDQLSKKEKIRLISFVNRLIMTSQSR